MTHDIAALEAKAKEVHALMLSLTADEPMTQFIKIIHNPGFTTPAEFTILNGILEALQASTKALAGLQQVALEGASRVELNPQPLPPAPPPNAEFNPQPDPPGKQLGAELNPQPLPPGKQKQ